MTSAGIVLYGPPASGKSSTAAGLATLGCRPYRPVKHGRGRTAGYRMVDVDTLHKLRYTDVALWEQHRYGSVYLWLRDEIRDAASVGSVALELGQPEAVSAVVMGLPDIAWTVVELTCPRPVAVERITSRATGDDVERIAAWDATPPLGHAHMRIDTSQAAAEVVAAEIWAHACTFDTPTVHMTDTAEVTRKAP